MANFAWRQNSFTLNLLFSHQYRSMQLFLLSKIGNKCAAKQVDYMYKTNQSYTINSVKEMVYLPSIIVPFLHLNVHSFILSFEFQLTCQKKYIVIVLHEIITVVYSFTIYNKSTLHKFKMCFTKAKPWVFFINLLTCKMDSFFQLYANIKYCIAAHPDK